MNQKLLRTSSPLSITCLSAIKDSKNGATDTESSDSECCHVSMAPLVPLSEGILQHLKSEELHSIVPNPLKSHEITKEYRAKMID